MTPAQLENARMLASILGISEDEASARLQKTVLITTEDSAAARVWAQAICAQLERTVAVTWDVDGPAPDIELLVGKIESRSAAPALYANLLIAGAWIGTEPRAVAIERPHALFAEIAACYCAASIFHKVINETTLPRSPDPLKIDFSELGVAPDLLDLPIDLTGSVLVGAGAVSNGFLRSLRLLAAFGDMPVVDPKTVGSGILNRCLFFHEGDIGLPKAAQLAAAAQRDFQRLTLHPHQQDFSAYTEQRGAALRAIITVDSRRARRTIQSELPLCVIDASTTDVREVVVHSNTALSGLACLACIYRHVPDELARERSIAEGLGVTLEDVAKGFIDAATATIIFSRYPMLDQSALVGMAFDSLFRQLCSEQALTTPEGRQVLAPFAFVSDLAGALLVIELVRQVYRSGARNENYWNVSPWAPPSKRARRLLAAREDCAVCSKATITRAYRLAWPDNFAVRSDQ